jgi:hypothetical protein
LCEVIGCSGHWILKNSDGDIVQGNGIVENEKCNDTVRKSIQNHEFLKSFQGYGNSWTGQGLFYVQKQPTLRMS